MLVAVGTSAINRCMWFISDKLLVAPRPPIEVELQPKQLTQSTSHRQLSRKESTCSTTGNHCDRLTLPEMRLMSR